MIMRGAILVAACIFASISFADMFGCVWGRIAGEKDPGSETPLFRFVVDKKAGYIDGSGNIAIAATFPADELNHGYDDFFEGVASVSERESKFIDAKGHPVTFGNYRVNGTNHFSEGLIPAELPDRPKKYGFIDHDGKLAFPDVFDEVGDCADGLAPVRTGDKWGYVNHSGDVVIAPRFLITSHQSEGLAHVIEEGPCKYDPRFRCAQARMLGLSELLNPGTKYPACQYTFIDKTGRRLGSGKFSEASDFKEGLAAVSDGKHWGFVDRTGMVRIPLVFESAGSFSEGRASFAMAKKWGFIDTEGRVVIEAKYDFARPFRSGAAAVDEGKKVWFIDRGGNRLFDRDYVSASSFALGLAHVDFGTEYGYIDRTGKVVFRYPHPVSKR